MQAYLNIFLKIFIWHFFKKSCKNKFLSSKDVTSGKINWNNILDYPNLPTEFIDCYFHQLKPFGIERRIKLNDVLIKKYGSLLNWYQLLTYQDIYEHLYEYVGYDFNQDGTIDHYELELKQNILINEIEGFRWLDLIF